MAMVHAKLGHRSKARLWFGLCDEWMTARRTDTRELLRFREEARQLLGLDAEEER